MTRRLAPITAAVLALLLASSLASAQEPPSLRAAPPPAQPDVLTAGPNAGAAAQESRDIAGRWLGASDAAIQEFGKVGGSLANIVTGKFSGLSTTIAIADWSSTVGALSAGDVRGAVSSAVAIKVGATVTSGGATLFGEIGAVTGGAVGSFFPVIGNVAGVMVGGAVGTAAGGFIAAFGYDKYIKDYVAKGVLAGIAAVIDPLPMAEMRAKMDALMLQAMSPEERAQLEASATFGAGEVQLLDFGTLPHVPVPKQPLPNVPARDAQQQAALPPVVVGDLLVGVRKFVLDGPTVCTIDSGQVNCTQPPANIGSAVHQISRSLSGVLNGNTLELELRDVFEARDAKCTVTTIYWGHYQVVLEDGGRALGKQTVTMSVTGCSTPMTTTNNYSGVGTWRVLE